MRARQGAIVTASIINQSVEELGLAVGGEAYAAVKASDPIIAVDPRQKSLAAT